MKKQVKEYKELTVNVRWYEERADYSEVHPGIISEAMGHSSITVTETYLKPFKNKKIDEANATVFSPFRKTFLKISC